MLRTLRTAAGAAVAWPLAAALFAMAVAAQFVAAALRRLCGRAAPAAAAAPDSAGAPAAAAGGAAAAGRAPATITVVDLDGVATEVMEWLPAAGVPEVPVTFVMIPGNPGAVDFYARYLSALAAACPGMHVVCVGHASHSRRVASPRRFSLAQQVAHKAAFLRRCRALRPRNALVLGGHSVGAYMALEAARALPAAAVAKFVLLTPTVRNIGATPNGVALAPVFDYFRGAAWMATYAVASLPAAVQRAVLAPGLAAADAAARDAALVLVHPDVAANALHLAWHEMREIREVDAEHVGAVAHKSVYYYAAADGWVNAGDPDYIAGAFPRATVVRCTEGHQHAFVLSPAASARVAALTWGWIAGDVAAATAAGGVPAAPLK